MMLLKKGRLLMFLGSQVIVVALFIHMSVHRHLSQREESRRPVHVLVLSSWRSGSSFVGQLFGQHPDVFYLMEPAWHVWMTFTSSTAWKLHMAVRDLLRSVFLCDMSVFDAYMNPGPRKQSSLFQWEQSRALCSAPVCDFFPAHEISSPKHCKLLCGQQPFDMVEKACRSHGFVVLKEHLETIKEEDQPYYAMKIICKSQVDIVKAIQTLPEALQQRYLFLRYEDLVRAPLAQTTRLYKFVGLDFLPHLQTWVYNVTRGKGMGQHAFHTNARNALNVSQAWRWSLPYEKVSQLQDACGEAMDLLGYLQVRSQQEQGNLSLDLLSSSHILGQVFREG